MNNNFSHFVGIDVAKDSFTVAVKSNDSFYVKSFNQTYQDFQNLISFLNSFPNPHNSIIAMESTSTYYLPLLNFLYSNNFNANVINPSKIYNFSKISLNPTKTDKIDAKTIANFLSFFPIQNQPNTIFSDTALFQFKILSRQYESVNSITQKVKTEIKRILAITFPEFPKNINPFTNSSLNILINFPSASAIKENAITFLSNFNHLVNKKAKFSPQQIIDYANHSIGINTNAFDEILKCQIKILIFLNKIKKELKEEIERKVEQINHPDINIITTIKGIGKVSACQFLAEIGDLRRFDNKKKVVSYIGTDPVIKQSGKYKGEWHISKKGNRHARRIVYLMATNVILYEEKFRKYYERLRGRGKTHKEAVIAVGNKIVHHIYSMVIHNRPYLQNYS